MPKVSVIIPVYNAEKYLHQCLDSVVNQTLHDIEIICVDDQSTDNSWNILREYAERDSRIRILQQKNAGAGAARNHGMRYAEGEYLSILDADDFFEPSMLEEAYNHARWHDAEIVVFGSDRYWNGEYSAMNYTIRKSLLPGHMPFAAVDVQQDLFKLFVGWSWDKLFRTDYVRENGLQFQVQRTTNDMLFVFSALVKASRIAVLPKVFVHYRQAEGTLSVTREKSWHCFYDALTALREQLKQWGLYERFERDYINYCVHFSLWNLNTLKEPTRTLLYNKLKDEWYSELGVLDHPADYFYNQHEYQQYRNVMEHPADWVPEKERHIILRGLDCLRDNGIRYTIRNIGEKIVRRIKK